MEGCPVLSPGAAQALEDPACPETWARWTLTARHNTRRHESLFGAAVPSQGVPTLAAMLTGAAEAMRPMDPPGATVTRTRRSSTAISLPGHRRSHSWAHPEARRHSDESQDAEKTLRLVRRMEQTLTPNPNP